MPLAFILLADRRLERRILRRAPAAALGLGRFLAQKPEHARSLLAAHDRDARVRPHPEKARSVSAPAHPVIAGTVAAADDDGVFRNVGGGDCRQHLSGVVGDADRLILVSDY